MTSAEEKEGEGEPNCLHKFLDCLAKFIIFSFDLHHFLKLFHNQGQKNKCKLHPFCPQDIAHEFLLFSHKIESINSLLFYLQISIFS